MTMTFRRPAIVTLLVLALAPAVSAEVGQPFSVRGAGLLDCESFVSERDRQSDAYLMIGGWIDGYITAANQHLESTYDVTSFESTELIAEIVANHCRSNPRHRLFTVMNSVVSKLHANRIEQPVRAVPVSDGVRSTALYAPTLERLQVKLIDGGYLEASQPSGRFDKLTKRALMAFQQDVDYLPTGFPDQGTLWRLLAE